MQQLDKYKKFLLNRITCNQEITEYIENSMITEDEMSKYSYHKILVCKWPVTDIQMFETISEHFGIKFIPINYSFQQTSFYTNSLMLILKILKADFMFPHSQLMYNIDIILNDKTSTDLFDERVTVEEIIAHIVSHRFNENCELNLSDFCQDAAFKEKKINFYKLSLLSHFKILMIRMGKDTKILNLSSNNLSQVPLDILNFFIKGDLIGVNLSNNNIPSIGELQRISSKIEKLWVEGNPLCENLDAITYIKQISQKFPRLTELDGVKLNEHGIMLPFIKNYMETTDRKTNMIVEKFIALYFAHYDSNRKKIEMFYDPYAHMTLSTDFVETPDDIKLNDPYAMHARNFLNTTKRALVVNKCRRVYNTRFAITRVLSILPPSAHDLSTFNVDVLKHDNKCLILIVDGVYKERVPHHPYERVLKFRRTFVFSVNMKPTDANIQIYSIVREMFSVSLATPEIINNSFKVPARNLIQLSLIDPDSEDKKAMCNIFIHYTQLKKNEAEARLKHFNWDLRLALKKFIKDFKSDTIDPDRFIEDDFSDVSSILEDEID